MKLSIYESRDVSDVSDLYPPANLFLKPMSRINITIHFPTLKQSIPTGGTNVSSWGIMEKLKALVAPDEFISIKTVKNTLEFIRFEGDLENRAVLKSAVGRLDGKKMKVTGIKEPLKILAAETKIPFPTKYDWDTFFRDARNMNEMKPGERPDTIYFQNLPIDWFRDSKPKDGEGQSKADSGKLPSERIFRRVWESFGDIRCVDIPILDPYRNKIKASLSGIKTFTFNLDRVFEAYVQFKEYLGFVKAMDALRCSFLVHKEDEKLYVTSIKVDFDKTRHLNEESISQREGEVRKLKGMPVKPGDKKASPKSSKDVAAADNGAAPEAQNLDKDVADIDLKIAMEERKYLVARRKLEAIRLIDFLFERLKARKMQEEKAEIKRRKKKRHLKRESKKATKPKKKVSATPVSGSGPGVTSTEPANPEEPTEKRTKTDEETSLELMRERLIAARKLGPEEARRKEMAAKSIKRAIQGTKTTQNFTARRVTLRQHQTSYTATVAPIYGSASADRAYEKYFQSLTKR